MFQRKQSLYLILSIVLLFISLFLPVANADQVSIGYFGVEGLADKNSFEGNPIFGGGGLILGIALYVIALMMFKNRKIQIKIVKIGSIIILLGVGYIVYIIYQNSLNYLILVSIPLLAVILSLLANKLIKKDDDLIRSVDRIR